MPYYEGYGETLTYIYIVFCLGKRDPLNLLASQGKRCLAIKMKKYFTNIIECQVMILFGLLHFRLYCTEERLSGESLI